MLLAGRPPHEGFKVTEFRPRAGAVHRFEEKAGFSVLVDYVSEGTPASSTVIQPADVVDVSDKLTEDGRLDPRDVPDGWTIIRFGYSLTGRRNFGSPSEMQGLEVDKLNGAHLRSHLDGLLQFLGHDTIDAGLDGLLFDSWEAGQQNWTENVLQAFKSLHGYDPLPFMPVLAGHVVLASEASDQFLHDWRATLGELLATEFYGVAADYADARGLDVAAQASGIFQRAIGDGMRMKSQVHVPMGEFWMGEGPLWDAAVIADVRETASTAHVYGKPVVYAETFTAGLPDIWNMPLYSMKTRADRFFAEGVNKHQLLCSAHNPLATAAPGMSCWRLGPLFSRGMNWAPHANAFTDYLARTSHMLQQGEPVADIAYLLGEGAPVTVPFWRELQPAPPPGYDYDHVDRHSLLYRSRAEDGMLMLDGGARYSVLVIPDHISHLSLPVLSRLVRLVEEGLTLVARPPLGSPGRVTDTDGETAYRGLKRLLWGTKDATGVRRVGAGSVWSQPEQLHVALKAAGATSAIEFAVRVEHVVWKERALENHRIWFIANTSDTPQEIAASLRGTGEAVEIWYPETGRRHRAAAAVKGRRTELSLSLAARESVFVMVGSPSGTLQPPPQRRSQTRIPLDRATWDLTLIPPVCGQIEVGQVSPGSLHEHSNAAVRDFSGLARYQRTVVLPRLRWDCVPRLLLDLGDVGETARLSVEGEVIGSDWLPPYRFDITEIARRARGTLAIGIEVATTWRNRLLADRGLPPGEATTQTVFRPYDPDSALGIALGSDPDVSPVLAGLIGPVSFIVERNRDCP